jgi:hypothetical protein
MWLHPKNKVCHLPALARAQTIGKFLLPKSMMETVVEE